MAISAQSKAFVVESVGITPAGSTPDVTVLTDGRFVVVWQETLGTPADGFVDTDGAIFARIYNTDGTAAGEAIQVNPWSPGIQAAPTVAAMADGGFAVAFTSTLVWGDSPTDIDNFAISFDGSGNQRPFFDSNGAPIAYIDIDPDNPGAPETGSFMRDLGNGYLGFVQEQDTSTTLTTVNILAPDGTLAGFVTVADLGNFDRVTDVSRLQNGNVVIVGETSGFVVLRLSNATLDGAPDGIPGLIGPVTFATMFEGSDANDVRITALDPGADAPNTTPGGFVVTALQPNGAVSSTLLMETFTSWGTKLTTGAISIAISLNGPHPAYDVLALKDGTFMVAWNTKTTNGLDILAGHFDADGTALGPAVVVQGDAASGDQIGPSLSLMADGKVLVAYTDLGNHAINGAIEPLHLVELTLSSTSGGYPATNLADKLNGTGGHDGIDGLAGNDTINGLVGNDVIYGGLGNDSMLGGVGNDAVIGGDGDDVAYGGDGSDGLSGGAGVDALYGEAGRDALQGGGQNDKLFGGTENDRLDGGLGNDRLAGGTGADVFVFRDGGGADVVTDFAADDFLRLDRALWSDVGDLTSAQVLTQFMTVVGGNAVLTFHGGETITLLGFNALVAGDLQLI